VARRNSAAENRSVAQQREPDENARKRAAQSPRRNSWHCATTRRELCDGAAQNFGAAASYISAAQKRGAEARPDGIA